MAETAGAFAILENKKSVLLVKRRDYPFWDLPGGMIENGELSVDAVKRGVMEETGLKVSPEYLVATYHLSF